MQLARFLIAIAMILGPTAAHADDAFAEAQALNTRGRALLDAGDPGGALAMFQRAYTRSPSAALLLNIGTSYKRLGRSSEAANAYQRYLDDPDADPERAADLRARVAALDAAVGRLAIDVELAAEVQIGDGMWMPAAQVRIVRIDPGTYVVRGRLGTRTAEVTGRIAAGDQQAQRLALAAPPVAPAAARVVAAPRAQPGQAAPPATSGRMRPAAAVAGGLGVAALAAGAVLAVRAHGRYGDARALCGDGCAEPSFGAARALSDAAGRDRWWSIGLAAGGTAAIAAGSYLWFHARGDRQPVIAAVAVVVLPGHLGFTFDHRF